MSVSQFSDRDRAILSQCRDDLESIGCYIAAEMLNDAVPYFSDELSTASVQVAGSQIRLFFNQSFFRGLSRMELGAVLVHEMLHVILRHVKRRKHLFQWNDRMCFDMACEILVNDIIVDRYPMLKLPDNGVTSLSQTKLIEVGMQGESGLVPDLSKKPISSLYTAECLAGVLKQGIMNLLAKQDYREFDVAEDKKSIWRRLLHGKTPDRRFVWEMPPDTNHEESNPDNDEETVDNHAMWDMPWDANSEELDPGDQGGEKGWNPHIDQRIDETLRIWSPSDSFGTPPLGKQRMMTAPHSGVIDVEQHLWMDMGQGLRSKQHEINWLRPDRRLYAFYPEVLLPSYPVTENHKVLYAIDASGSVPDEYVALALRIAETPVRGVEQAIISFDAEVYPVEDRKVRGGGGTVVQKVEDWIRAGRHYPDRVFVFTDGEFEAPRLLFPHRWTWFLIEGGSCDAIPAEGRIETLKCIVALPIVVRRGEGADSAWVSQKTGYDKKMWIDMRGRGESIIN